MSEYRWSKQLGVLIHSDDFRQQRIPFIGTQKEWNQTLLDTIDKCFTEIDDNRFVRRCIIANRKNCKLLETFDEFVLDWKKVKMSNEDFTRIGIIRYIDVEILFDRTVRDDTLFCISEGYAKKEIKILE